MDAAQLIVGVGMLASSVALAWLTFRLARATDSMAKASAHRPYVFLFMRQRHAIVGLRNVGDRVAHNVRVRIERDDFAKADRGFLGQLLLFKHPIQSIPPGGQAQDLSVLEVITAGSTAEFTVVITYTDDDGHVYRERTRARAADYADYYHNVPMGGSADEDRTVDY